MQVRKKLSHPKYISLETRKDGIKFTSKALREAAEQLQFISREYDSKQQQLIDQVRVFAFFFPSRYSSHPTFTVHGPLLCAGFQCMCHIAQHMSWCVMWHMR